MNIKALALLTAFVTMGYLVQAALPPKQATYTVGGYWSCTDLGKAVMCVEPGSAKLELTKVTEAVDAALPKAYPIKPTLAFVSPALVGSKMWGFYYGPTATILIGPHEDLEPGNPQIYMTIYHELWHFRMSQEGIDVRKQHCKQSREAEYFKNLSRWMTPDYVRSHRFRLALYCMASGGM